MRCETRKSFLRFCEWKRSGIWIVLFHSLNSLLYKWLRGKSGSERGFQLSWRFWFFIIRQLYSSRPRMARIHTDLFWMFYIFLNTDFSDLRGFFYIFSDDMLLGTRMSRIYADFFYIFSDDILFSVTRNNIFIQE